MTTRTLKNVARILPRPQMHWVGDGFPVSSVISPHATGASVSPFVLMDYAGPAKFGPSDTPRGVDTHPHRGFETVTVVYKGELEHRDSAGNKGCIGAGDVQWMTAASGVLHEEKHSAKFTREGGVLEMAQLWVNLPAKHKKDKPRYQELQSTEIPSVTLPDGAGKVRVIAGDFDGTKGAAQTFTPVTLWDVSLKAGARVELPVADGHTAAIYVRSGSIRVGDSPDVQARQLVVLELSGEGVVVQAGTDTELLVVGGEPINEPMIAHGPFVMNTVEEVQQAMADYRSGKFGRL